jgi:hypothetical protein
MKKAALLSLLLAAACSANNPHAHVAPAAVVDSTPTTATTPVISTLQARRQFIQFPTYTPDQRQLIANEAQVYFRDLWVHRDEKIAFYGPLIDPVPKIDLLVTNAKTMTDEQFHLALQAIYESVRDDHTNYYMPYPYGCYLSELPLNFTAISDPTPGAILPLIAVASLTTSPAVLNLVPQLPQIAVGDVLVSYDGLPALLAIAAQLPGSDGTNVSGAFQHALARLSFRPQVFVALPANDTIKLTLQRLDGSRYDIELPWLSLVRRVCQSGIPASLAPPPPSKVPDNLAKDDFQDSYEEAYQITKGRADGLGLTLSADPILSYGKVTNAHGTFGYMLFSSFQPTLSTPAMTDEFARILRDEMKDTTGLIIDVRDNPGGYINLADALPQLFSANPVGVNGFRFINTDLNATIVNTQSFQGSEWQTIVNEVHGTNARYTRTAQFTTDASANSRTQVYFKPVAVLTNGNCFSSCDMFSASMQDNALAKLWGEDATTGAGGANVETDSYFRGLIPAGQNNPFSPLPGGQIMRVAWRQAVRVGMHAGELIEDFGVARDENALKTSDDVLNHGATQLEHITSDLAALSTSRLGSIYLQETSLVDIAVGNTIGFDATIADTDSVEVLRDGQLLTTQSVGVGAAQLVHIDTGVAASSTGLYSFELHGLRNGARVWRAFATARAVPPYAPLPANGLSLDFSTGNADPLVIYTQEVSPLDGWHVQNGKLTTTRGTNYLDDTLSDAVLFVDLTGRTSLNLNLHGSIDTEPGFDFFRIYTVVAGQRTLVAELSGHLGDRDLSYDLSALAGQKAQIDFQLSSDSAVNFTGVFLDHISLQ